MPLDQILGNYVIRMLFVVLIQAKASVAMLAAREAEAKKIAETEHAGVDNAAAGAGTTTPSGENAAPALESETVEVVASTDDTDEDDGKYHKKTDEAHSMEHNDSPTLSPQADLEGEAATQGMMCHHWPERDL
jgi:hypothetical protein